MTAVVALQRSSGLRLLQKMLLSLDGVAFVSLAALKSAIALAGFRAFAQHGRQAVRHGGAVVVPGARFWLWTYVLMQIADTMHALRQGYDWTSLVHHLASGLGFAADAFFGSERTVALSVMALAAEAVGPFYLAHGLLRGAGLGASSLARRCVWGVIFCTFLVRLPVVAFLGVLACRDSSRFMHLSVTRRNTIESSAQAEALREVQPWLLLPAVGGLQLILYLDYLWITGWALPNLRKGPLPS